MRLFVTMLREQSDSKISALTLQTLNSMLMEMPMLSLQGEPQDCLDAFQGWLLSVVDKNSKFSSSIQNEAMESILAFGLSTGSLTTLLHGCYILAGSVVESNENNNNTTTTESQHPFQELKILPFIKQLNNWQVDLILSPLSRDKLSGTLKMLFVDRN